MNLQENIDRIKEVMGIEDKEENQIVQIFSNGGGSEIIDRHKGKIKKILVSNTLPNEPFKDKSYMEKSDNIKNMIKSINDGDELPPIVAIQHPYDKSKYVVVDGNHRRYAYTKSNVDEINAIIIPHKDVVLMKSKWGDDDEYLGHLNKLKNNHKIVDRYFVKPDGTNSFKKTQ